MKPTRRETKEHKDPPAADSSAVRAIRVAERHLSLILILAGLAQIAIGWLKSSVLIQTVLPQPQSSLIANRFYFDFLLRLLVNPSLGETPGPRVEYIVCLLIALLSAVPIYFLARRWLGSLWALMAGLLYVVYPTFAWFVADAGPLAFFVFLLPNTWLLLLRWNSEQRAWTAFLLGIGLALMTLINFAGLFLLPLIIAGLWLHRAHARRCLIGIMMMLLGYALLVLPTRSLLSTTDRIDSETAMTVDFWNAIDNADGSAIAKAARLNKTSPRPLLFLQDQARESPSNVIVWVLRRAWRTLYLSSDDRLHQIVFFLQLFWMIPALWGFVTAYRCADRRWATVLAGGLVFSFWGMAAVVEPLARNLTPLLGIALIFALTGIRDISSRIGGRRVSVPAVKTKFRRR